MNKYLSIIAIYIGSLSFSTSAFSCEPVSLDWERFHQQYDLNQNNTFELSEFKKVIDFSPYPWPQDKEFQGKNKHELLFKYLDKNQDSQLNDEELGAIHSLFDNPCDGWPWD